MHASGTAATAPPRATSGPIGWLRENLFSSWTNAALTVLALWLIYETLATVLGWAVLNATWQGRDGSDCARHEGGACWPFVSAWFGQFLYGRYPDAERWRVNLTYILAVAGLAPLMIPRVPHKLWSSIYLLVVFPVLAVILLSGGVFGLRHIPTDLWGGLLVTLVIASAGIAAAFPIAIVLALGRRSRMPAVRWASIGFIEFVRGVPLITVLFMASVMLPLFLPEQWTIDKLVRALIMVALFSAAYLAEVIRGGLQAIPRGQFEAADALGLSYPKKMGLIVLPQALKLVIPGIVGSFISLFKDTSLVLIIGIFDLLGMAQIASSSPAWLSPATPMTGYVVAGVIFWVFCFGMSRYSQMLERRLAAGSERVVAKAVDA
ncbi:MAG TPA: amino acid ABC transporter permease [Hyphomicrobiaceae bacterium]|jgi:general L-amino acid transport system permease protein|nr:amino acid ABC transporter permease [Hyphomicrobiaceae bacterium]